MTGATLGVAASEDLFQLVGWRRCILLGDSGFGVWVMGFRGWGTGFRVQGSGSRVEGVGLWVEGLGRGRESGRYSGVDERVFVVVVHDGLQRLDHAVWQHLLTTHHNGSRQHLTGKQNGSCQHLAGNHNGSRKRRGTTPIRVGMQRPQRYRGIWVPRS